MVDFEEIKRSRPSKATKAIYMVSNETDNDIEIPHFHQLSILRIHGLVHPCNGIISPIFQVDWAGTIGGRKSWIVVRWSLHGMVIEI